MSIERVKRQICLLLSIITILSGMCLVSEQTDACFLLPDMREQVQWIFWELPGMSEQIQWTTEVDQGDVLVAADALSEPEFSCTGEMLGLNRGFSAQQTFIRFLGGLRNKTILALSFVGLFLLILILFPMAVYQFGFCKKPGHTVIIQYIHSLDGKKSLYYNI